ncbi:MAG TPA: metallophosphoesterase [Pirellulales bacterium]|nr:metallophosphoesterase [Pirellulales bacterium]
MPIHLPPISRRRFLAGGAAALAAGFTPRLGWTDAPASDPHFFALISDIHVAADPKESNRGVTMTDNFRRVAEEIVSLKTKPAAAFINGDCAYLHGLTQDYRQLASLLDPISKAGLPLHLGMGNHDDRESFADVLTSLRPENPPVTGRFASVVAAERANWFVLDSLRKTNDTPGELGEKQREWLAKALDAKPDKPAIVVCHHNPAFELPELTGALLDTEDLFNVLRPRSHVKALIFGHTHDWRISQRDGIHLINLPPTAYLFIPSRPNGWVSAHLEKDRMTLAIHALDKNHPEAGKTHELKWRAA